MVVVVPCQHVAIEGKQAHAVCCPDSNPPIEALQAGFYSPAGKVLLELSGADA